MQIISFDTTGYKGRRARSERIVRDTRLEEAIKKAYELPGELLRRDVEAFNQMQTESSLTKQPSAKGEPR
jgi:hypothetical protein